MTVESILTFPVIPQFQKMNSLQNAYIYKQFQMIFYNIQMAQEDDPEQFQERLNQMKAFNFRQERDDKLKKQIIQTLLHDKLNKSRRKHCVGLYCKVFKSLMTYSLQLNDFYTRLNHLYIHILLQHHFTAMKQFVMLREQERKDKIKLITNMLKRRSLGFLLKRHKKITSRKIKQIKYESPTNQVKFKTQDNFYPNKPFDKPIEPPFIKTVNLQDSRKSSHSLYNVLDKPTRRKFIPIKQVPQLPILSVQQQKKEINQSKINNNDLFQEKEKEKDILYNKKQQKHIQDLSNNKSLENNIIKQQKQQEQIKSDTKKWQKDKILALISQISITSWLQMNDIIQDYTNSTLKSESLLSQKANLTRNHHIIERIASLR